MTSDEAVTKVMAVMPELAQDALATIVQVNLTMDGAHWDDVLEMLLDADYHLEVTEPAFEAFGHAGPPVALTLLYAYRQEPSNELIQFYVTRMNEVTS